MHWLSTFLYVEAKFGPLEKRIKKIESNEMKFLIRTARYTFFDHRRNEYILEELKVEPVDEKLGRYKSNWLHVTRLNNNRMAEIMVN